MDSKILKKLSKMKNIVKTVSADQIVIKHDSSWKEIIKQAYQREPTLSTIKKEINGVRQIKDRTYKFK